MMMGAENWEMEHRKTDQSKLWERERRRTVACIKKTFCDIIIITN
jgi:hypothetical protein